MSPPAVIVFRCDASSAIGTGHIRRCLSLALALRQRGARCMFVTRQSNVDTAAIIKAEGFECITLARSAPDHVRGGVSRETLHASWLGRSQQQDADDTLQALSRSDLPPMDWLVADHYALEAHWHRQIRSVLNCRIAAIDDLGDRHLEVDLLIDHNYAADHKIKYADKLPAKVVLLGGPRFALLAPAYSGAPKYLHSDKVSSIGIFMGGVDASVLTLMALQTCDRAGFEGAVEIAATSAYAHLAEVRAAAAARPQTTVTVDQPHLADFFGRHDLQIGAGGGATWERCCMGVPTIALETADNQRKVLAPLRSLGVVEVAAPSATPNRPSLESALRTLLASPTRRQELASRSRELVDGNGAARAAAAMLELTERVCEP